VGRITKMKHIEIHGLNSKQIKMLDTLWSLKSREDLEEWMNSLTTNEFKMAIVLQELLVLEYTDEVKDMSMAKEYLRKFRL
jgi:hypothetical protein